MDFGIALATTADCWKLNVTKLGSDNVDPRKYLGRLDKWESRVNSGGGKWKVINDMDRLEKTVLQ